MEDPQNGKNTPTCVQMNRILAGEQFTFLADQDKAFILAFGQSMSELGYAAVGRIKEPPAGWSSGFALRRPASGL